MNRTLSIIYLLFISLALNAHKLPIDSTGFKLADSLLVKANEAMGNVDIKKTIELSSEALDLSIKQNYDLGTIRAYYILGQGLFNNQNYKESLSYLSKAIKVKGSSKYPLYMSQIHKVRGQIFYYVDVFDDSIIEFNKALEAASKITNSSHRGYITSQIYESLAIAYSGIGDTEKALSYMMENVELLNGLDEDLIFRNKINQFTSLGEHYIIDKKLDSAKYFIDESLSIIDKYDYAYKCRTLRFLGDVHKMQNDLNLSLQTYSDAYKNANALGMKYELQILHENFADVYQQLNMPDSVNKHLERMRYFENDNLREKVNAADTALKELVLQEKSIYKYKRNMFLTVVSLTAIIFILVVILLWKRKHKLIIEEVEEETQELKQKLNEAFDEVMNLAKRNEPAFLIRFQEVYPTFYNNLTQKHTDLTPTDLRLCAMTYLNFTTSDIARYTYVELRSVQARRSRLRKKIDLAPDVDLLQYLQSLG